MSRTRPTLHSVKGYWDETDTALYQERRAIHVKLGWEP